LLYSERGPLLSALGSHWLAQSGKSADFFLSPDFDGFAIVMPFLSLVRADKEFIMIKTITDMHLQTILVVIIPHGLCVKKGSTGDCNKNPFLHAIHADVEWRKIPAYRQSVAYLHGLWIRKGLTGDCNKNPFLHTIHPEWRKILCLSLIRADK